jgi:hypothetical protein
VREAALVYRHSVGALRSCAKALLCVADCGTRLGMLGNAYNL